MLFLCAGLVKEKAWRWEIWPFVARPLQPLCSCGFLIAALPLGLAMTSGCVTTLVLVGCAGVVWDPVGSIGAWPLLGFLGSSPPSGCLLPLERHFSLQGTVVPPFPLLAYSIEVNSILVGGRSV